MEKEIDQAKWFFFLNLRKRNDAPTVSDTPPTGNNPIGAKDSIRNATTPILKNIAQTNVDPRPGSDVSLEKKQGSETVIERPIVDAAPMIETTKIVGSNDPSFVSRKPLLLRDLVASDFACRSGTHRVHRKSQTVKLQLNE